MSEPNGRGGRRDFLDPARLLAGMRSLQNDGGAARSAEAAVVTFSRPAMACLFEIQLPAESPGRASIPHCFDRIDDIEAKLTIYRPDSVISEINQRGFGEAVAVDEETFVLLKRSVELHATTAGAFDVTAGPLIRAWGFHRRQGRLPAAMDIRAALAAMGSHLLTLDGDQQTVRLQACGMELNLGAIGKGYALDRCGAKMRAEGIRAALLSAGHSSMLAIGSPPWDTAWQVDLADPRAVGKKLGSIRLVDQALSTTGAAEQHFEVDGRRYGHVLDPRTGWPAEGILQATAIAADAAAAEAFSTAFFINGVEWTRDFCRRHPHVAAILLPADGELAQPIGIGAVTSPSR